MLFERAAADKPMHGFTRNYLRAELPASDQNEQFDNQLVRVRLGNFNADATALMAEIIK